MGTTRAGVGLGGAVMMGLAVVPTAQTPGTVLTAVDMEVPHLMTRPAVVEGREWLGLQITEERSYVVRAAAEWVGSEEFGDSVFTLFTDPAGMSLLVADVPGIEEGPAVTVVQFEEALQRGSELTLELEGQRYGLLLGGVDVNGCDATVALSDGERTQELYFPEDYYVSCDEPHFSVQWAGDLDGDGRLDLVTTLSPKYSFYPRRLYLSSAAEEGMIVGLVAGLDGTAA